MIKFSCADYTFPLLAPAQRFDLLKLLGFTHVDIGLFERSDGLTPSQLQAAPRKFTRKLRNDLKRSGLQVSDIFLQAGVAPSIAAATDPSPKVRSCNRTLFSLARDLCHALDCQHLTGLPGVWNKRRSNSADFHRAADEAAWRQQAATDAGVTYAIEPHVGSICSDIASTRALLDAVPGLSLTLDYGHFIAQCIPSDEVHALLPFASHIHVRGGEPRRLQTPVSENKIDFAGMVGRLSQQRYSGFLALEYVHVDWQGCNRADNVSETLLLRQQLAAWMKPNRLRA